MFCKAFDFIKLILYVNIISLPTIQIDFLKIRNFLGLINQLKSSTTVFLITQ